MKSSFHNAALRLSITALGCAASAFALDEYLPLASRVMEIDIGAERGTQLGYFDANWDKQDMEQDKSPFIIPLQGKFGLTEGLDGSMSINFIGQDVEGHSGLDRPVFSLKYAHPVYHVGGFLSIAPPIGFEEIMNTGNYASLAFGALYGKDWAYCKLLANASYIFNTENEDKTKEDQLRIFVKPEYPLPITALTKAKQYLGVNLGMDYDFYFNEVDAGESLSGTRQLFTLLPGVNYTLNRFVSAELTGTFPVSGKSGTHINSFYTANVQSVRLQVYFTLDENFYNAVGN